MNAAYIQGINPMLKLSQEDVQAWLDANNIQAEVEFSPRRIGVVTLASAVVFSSEDDLRKFYLEFLEPRRLSMV